MINNTRFDFSRERTFFFPGCKAMYLNFNFHQSNLFHAKQSFYLFRNIDVRFCLIYRASVRIFINIRSAIKLIAAVSFANRFSIDQQDSSRYIHDNEQRYNDINYLRIQMIGNDFLLTKNDAFLFFSF